MTQFDGFQVGYSCVGVSSNFFIFFSCFVQTDKDCHCCSALYRFLHSWVSMTCLSQLTVGAKVARVWPKFHGRQTEVWMKEYIHTKACASVPGRKRRRAYGIQTSFSLFCQTVLWITYFETTFFESLCKIFACFFSFFQLKEIRWCCCWAEEWWVQPYTEPSIQKFHSQKTEPTRYSHAL